MTEDDLFARRPLGMRMAMVVRQWRAIIDSAITDTGLTQSSWTVLMQLHQLGDNVSVSELAEVQGIELPPLMRTLSLLEKQGYLVRSTSPYDKRIRLLTLTAEGRAILEKLSCVIETYQERVTQTIPEADLATFSATLNQIACRFSGNIRLVYRCRYLDPADAGLHRHARGDPGFVAGLRLCLARLRAQQQPGEKGRPAV